MNDILYKEMILDLYRNPLNKKKIDHPDCCHKELNVSCGDEIEISLKIEEGKIIDIGHQGSGCAISQAAVSLLTEEVKGKLVSEVELMAEKEMLALFPIEISANRMNCALLGYRALLKCLIK